MFLRLIQNFIAHHSPLTDHRSSLKKFFCPISIPIAVVLRCPFKISSTAVAVYLHRPMQYICSKKPMRCLDKVTALHSLMHRIVFANAPRCVFSLTLQEWRTNLYKGGAPSTCRYAIALLHASLIADKQGCVGACFSAGVEEGTV